MRYPALPSGLRKLLASDRLRHVAIAAVIAVVVAMSTVLRPLDITIWSLQSKMFDVQPSGDIVLVEVEQGDEPGMIAEGNAQLTRTLAALDEAGAARLFIDIPLQRSRSSEIDLALRAELERLGNRVVLTRTYQDETLAPELRGSDPFFERGMRVASNDLKKDFLGYVWEIEPDVDMASASVPALWQMLAKRDLNTLIFPDYSIRIDKRIEPSISATKSSLAISKQAMANRDAVVTGRDNNRAVVRMPGQGTALPASIHIQAAETAKRGSGGGVGWPLLLAVTIILLIFISRLSTASYRRAAYLGVVGVFVLSVPIASGSGVRLELANCLFLILVFAVIRSVSLFRQRHLFLEQRSRLPNFNALGRDMSAAEVATQTAVVIVKIARLDAVFSMLDLTEQSRYIRQIAMRLALGDRKTTIYYDGGKYFAFGLSRSAHENPAEHLEGLRAIVSQAITVGGRDFDVSLTIGADTSFSTEVSSRINSAIAAADQAREAYRPVFVISDFAADSEEWDYSLQARLETALSEDRISIKLQPQIDLQSGKVVGAEALARWKDEKHGEVSPARFILQCERVGRLDELTKRVFFKSLQAARGLHDKNLSPQISINVSAVQFVDGRIADLIAEQIERTGGDPSKLTVEVTETARIDNFTMARDVIERIKATGAQFSLDDFGIGSANFDALCQLPFDEVKIDRTFVMQAASSVRARAMVAAIVKLANDAKIVSVAEGIEDAATLDLIREMGCQMGQGYHIARPMKESDFESFLRSQQVDALVRKAR